MDFASYSFLVFQDRNEKVEAQPNDTGGQEGEWPPAIIPCDGDSREGGTALTRREAALVETIWGAASFGPSQKVRVNPRRGDRFIRVEAQRNEIGVQVGKWPAY